MGADTRLVGTAASAASATDGPRRRSVLALVRRHRLFALVFAAGVVLRIVATIAYRPALLYIDSIRYLENMDALRPTMVQPVGYSIFLRPLTFFGDLRVVPLVQHAMGLAMALGIYVLLLRAGARRWVATLAATPLLLDAYQVHIEHNILTEALFQSLIFLTLVLLVDGAGRPRPVRRRLLTAGLAGLLLGMAVPVRLIGQYLIVPAVAFLLIRGGRRVRERSAAALVCLSLFAVPVIGYMAWFASWTGNYALTSIGGHIIYGRAAVIADCDRVELPAAQRDLCPEEPRGQRGGVDDLLWNLDSPIKQHVPPPGMSVDESLRSFGLQVIRQQPLDYLQAVLVDVGKNFLPTKRQFPDDVAVARWHFQQTHPDYGGHLETFAAFDARPEVSPRLASWLRSYQLSVGYTPGTVLGLALLLGLAGGLGFGRARRSPLRAAALLWSVFGGVLLLLPSTFEFSWRYMLPALVTVPVGAALSFTALTDGRRSPVMKEDAMAADNGEAVDDAAIARFLEQHGSHGLPPIVAVIAAYNEEEALGDVLDAIPAEIDGTRVGVVVVDDGSTDATADVGRRHGARVVAPGVNRGQGAALRLGYRVAREGGARFIATLDADGQYDPAELRTVLRPVLRDRADFVTGSRRLGREETTDRFRRAGVRFYAAVVSVLTRQRITDTSFGLRAMRAEVTSTVTLRQPQYQSAELLIGALAHGYRVAEVPTTMRERAAGMSKKGNNLLYGLRYGRVVVGTWVRERARRRARSDGADRRGTGDRTARTSRGTARR